jgi:plastocyanin
MSTQRIKIQQNSKPTPDQPAVFSPQSAVANAGDNLTWYNADGRNAHWPAPKGSPQTAWFQYQIPSLSESRGDLTLSANPVNVTAATNANPVVLTTQQPAPANGLSVKLTYDAPNPPPGTTSSWAVVNGKTFVVTNLGPNRCSIPLDSSGFGSFSGTIIIFVPYTLNYVCALHPGETGIITVDPQL